MIWIAVLASYLIGGLPFSSWLVRWSTGADVRLLGSGNPGATNMLRLAGRGLAIGTLFGDLLKGLLPVLCASALGLTIEQQAWIGLAAVLGHSYPLYFRFRGGKGVATAAGVLFGLHPATALLALLIWLTVFTLSRTSSLAALAALPLCLPLLAWMQPTALWPMGLLAALVVWRHRNNLRDLSKGRERHF